MQLLKPYLTFRCLLLVAVFLLHGSVLPAQDFPLIDDDEELVAAAVETSESSFLSDGSSPVSIEQLRSMESIFAETIEMVAAATVNIMVDEAQGSGVVVSRDGYILTAAHVIGRPNREAIITFADGSKADAITLGVNRSYDSGMLKITEKGKWPFVDIGESEPLKQGQWVLSIGHPGGLTIGRGLVSRAGRILSKPESTPEFPSWLGNNGNAIVTDCTLVGGDSGGPLVDLDGYVIGIHSRIGSRLSENYHVPIDAFSRDWDELADAAIVGSNRPYLGINLDDKEKDKVKVKEVVENEGASKAGMKADDIIIRINDKETGSIAAFRKEMKKFKAKDKITIVVKRGDEEFDLEVTLGYDFQQKR